MTISKWVNLSLEFVAYTLICMKNLTFKIKKWLIILYTWSMGKPKIINLFSHHMWSTKFSSLQAFKNIRCKN